MATSGALPGTPLVKPKSRVAWRNWLSKRHASSPGTWLVVRKKASRIRGITYEQAVEEALCFGWIDGGARSLDKDSFRIWLSPRRPRSVWSRINKRRVEELVRSGLMTPAGLAKIEEARRDGTWNSLDDADALKVPADLRAALAGDAAARKNFASFSASSRKIILFWIQSAKRDQTRARRIVETVSRAARNLKPGFGG